MTRTITSLLYLGVLTLNCSVSFGETPSMLSDAGEKLPEHSPQVCSAFTRLKDTGAWGMLNGLPCADNSAVFEAVPIGPVHRNAPPEELTVAVTCCGLPSTDILTNQHVTVKAACPDNYVVTGQSGRTSLDVASLLRCTKINTKRYMLAKSQPARFWGVGSSNWKERYRIMREDVPLALRNALGRAGKYLRNQKGCVGYPFGSMLVEKRAKRCYEFFFQQLQYRGLPGDPPAGTPVTMFPDCRYVDDPLAEQPSCIAAEGD